MRTPIMVAALHDNAEAVETLVTSGVKVDDKDDVSAVQIVGVDTIAEHAFVGVFWWEIEQEKPGLMVQESAWYCACTCSMH